jgi:predicted transcriptional regulator
MNDENLIELTASIAAAHVSNNTVSISDMPLLISNIHGALMGLGPKAEPETPVIQPAVNPKKSIRPEGLISLIDGRPYKLLRRHLAAHGHTPESYRETYGLPRDYPMVAANYSDQRRDLAVSHGLGRHRENA